DINALGQRVDKLLQKNDVRLTMGGEPTFVSIDDMQSPQWNTDADGPHKRKLAMELTEKLKAEFAPGGLLHVGQGKWYPGEPLPRWQNTLYWRKDGKALWPGQFPQADAKPVKPESARALLRLLCAKMDLPASAIHPAYEDAFYTLWREANLPLGEELSVDHEALAKRTLAQLLEQGLNQASGYCLPLGFNVETKHWQTCRWRFRQSALYLVPGNSPIGLRLPLTSLSQQAKAAATEAVPADPFAPLPQELEPLTFTGSEPAPDMAIHTALCTEVRDGKLYVFLPPVTSLEEFCGLIDAIAAAAAELQLTPYIEGYQPPFDPRLGKLAVTPDPGVIEVNVQPTSSWNELTHLTERLYVLARESRLATE